MEDSTLDTGLANNSGKHNPQFKLFLRDAAKWSNFLAILGFIATGLMFLGALASLFLLSNVAQSGMEGSPLGGSIAMFLVYLLVLAIYALPSYYLYKFSKSAKNAVYRDVEVEYTNAMKYLKNFFQFLAIMIIVVFAIYGLFMVFGLSMLSAAGY